MKLFLSVGGILCLILLSAAGHNKAAFGEAATAQSLAFTFTPNSATISTSEGAPYGDTDFWQSKITVSTAYGYGPTKVIRVYICLSGEVSLQQCSAQPAVTGPLSPAMLKGIDSGIAAYDRTGIRIMPRFTYNFGPIGPGAMDAPLKIITRHIDQVAPILLKHKDLIFALEAGFIGTWGEWHDSTNGNDTPHAQAVVLHRELRYFGQYFPIVVRRPAYDIEYAGLTRHRPLGLHDDYYASNAFDAGTWLPTPTLTTAQLQNYAQQVSTTSLFVGEFGALYPTLQNCAALDAYSTTYHVQSISLGISPKTVGNYLDQQGCATSFFDKVGARIEITGATLTGDASPGAVMRAAVTLANTGYGRVIRERPVILVLLSGAREIARIPVGPGLFDLRKLAAGASRTFGFAFALPARLPKGSITVALLFQDPAPSLKPQAAYALPLNSVDQAGNAVFDPATGLNQFASFTVN